MVGSYHLRHRARLRDARPDDGPAAGRLVRGDRVNVARIWEGFDNEGLRGLGGLCAKGYIGADALRPALANVTKGTTHSCTASEILHNSPEFFFPRDFCVVIMIKHVPIAPGGFLHFRRNEALCLHRLPSPLGYNSVPPQT